MEHPDERRALQLQNRTSDASAMSLGGNLETGEFFNSSAVGWLLRLLFFPSGVLSLILIGLLLERGSRKVGANANTGDVDPDRQSEDVEKAFVAELERELERMCNALKIGKQRQKDLELCGRIDSSSCGYCLGEGGGCFGYVQLPCGHFHHAQCVRRAFGLRLYKCADCGDIIVNVECALRNLRNGQGRHTV